MYETGDLPGVTIRLPSNGDSLARLDVVQDHVLLLQWLESTLANDDRLPVLLRFASAIEVELGRLRVP